MAKARADRGGVTAEAAVSMGLLMLVTSTGLGLAYMAFAQTWIRNSSYEAVVCLAAESSRHECRLRLETMLKGALARAQISRIQLQKTGREARVDFELEILPGLVWRETRRLALPLRARGRD